ncbi:MAG: dTMP kinase [Actinobacteria bacterium]|nr:dTMP kinase [Actinomycetota bacterium]MBU1492899.1 dTMP kinase [Actinomycetota bacterium]
MTWRYLAIEGVDGAGKTTVAAAIAAALEGRGEAVLLVREPGGTPTGEAIRRILLHSDDSVAAWTEAMLFAASRAQLAAELVGPALEAGMRVVSDRTVYSSLAYQGGARGLGIDRVREVNEAGLQGVWPDRVLLLVVDPASGLEREDAADRISVEGIALQARVAAAYDDMARQDPERFEVVDASRPIDLVVADALAALVGP